MGEAVIVKTTAAWIAQARGAHNRLVMLAEFQGRIPKELSLRELADVDRTQFGYLIEAFVALGQPVSQELKDLAGLRPVREVLGL